ncbi:aspartate--ammonia ligase [Desulfogranum mediterraneum]|uniref:aspartate--ammonia ligase n=1 Tax=Desulfogranum mediterraneum TaxID=160661 RepID=UPI0003FA1576|nr:aspartate--ammonia ligase [Desulfogranum mediterraneum]
MTEKRADLAGPGIGDYHTLGHELPDNYHALLAPMERMKAVFAIKNYLESGLCRELNLNMVQVPLIVDRESGVNDYLDRDGSRTPVEFPCGLGLDPPIRAQIVQAATKWKRMALEQFGCQPGEGICTDMRAVRKDYFLDHDHSAYVDQWDWEQVITREERSIDFLRECVSRIWKVIRGAGTMVQQRYPQLRSSQYPDFPEELTFIHAEELLKRYPDLPRKERETRFLREQAQAIFIIGIGWPLKDGYPHELRAADYDDWAGESIIKNGEQYHGLNGDILVWNPVTQRRHELSSMGIRVTRETLKLQLKMAAQEELLALPYHQAILKERIPLSIGGGIGQARTFMYLLRTAHLGEVTVSVWPKKLKEICLEKNIHLLG